MRGPRLATARRALGLAAALAAFAGLAGCRRLDDRRAEALVRRYNARLVEAYRTGDSRLLDGLVSDSEAKKIFGLIGVKTDMGITLDAGLTDFRMIGTERPGPDAVEALTEERWSYRDRRIGSGEVVGEESADHYFMRYSLRRIGRDWVVSSVGFERPPEVGRSSAPNRAPARAFHGIPEAPPRSESMSRPVPTPGDDRSTGRSSDRSSDRKE